MVSIQGAGQPLGRLFHISPKNPCYKRIFGGVLPAWMHFWVFIFLFWRSENKLKKKKFQGWGGPRGRGQGPSPGGEEPLPPPKLGPSAPIKKFSFFLSFIFLNTSLGMTLFVKKFWKILSKIFFWVPQGNGPGTRPCMLPNNFFAAHHWTKPNVFFQWGDHVLQNDILNGLIMVSIQGAGHHLGRLFHISPNGLNPCK